MTIEQSAIDRLNEIARQELASMLPHYAASRYWIHNGYQYHYTTERVDGKFYAMIYKPIGKGARTGGAQQWKLQKKIARAKRKDAKALAFKWYTLAKDSQ